MSARTEAGFTLVESMLFLAITGLLVMGILVGSGAAITQQRYRDSVNSLKSFIQDQYSDVTNVTNSRNNQWQCDAGGNVTEASGADAQARGTSNCVLLGRYITVNDNGTMLSGANVIGYRAAGAETATSDVVELQENYTLQISPLDQEEQEVRWGSQVVQPESSTPLNFSMLVLRSPLSGSIITFAATGIQAPEALLMTENVSTQHDLCVDADLNLLAGQRLAVRVAAYATNQAAISIPPESEGVCD
jgi:Tfp pilus assembly protein FimT